MDSRSVLLYIWVVKQLKFPSFPLDGIAIVIILLFNYKNREMDNNRIPSLPPTVFKDLYYLKDLFIEHNFISWIPTTTFQSSFHMEFL